MPERGRGYDVAVLGGGCAAAAIAYSLARRRIIPVVIETDQGSLPAPAWPVASVLDGNIADIRLAIRGAERLPDLQDAVGPFGYRRTGGMWAALSDADAAAAQTRAEAARAAGLPVFWLSREETLRREPGLSDRAAGSVYTGYDGVAHAPALTRMLLAAAGRFGAAALLDCGYVIVVRQPGSFRITAGRDEVIAQRLVIASGPMLRALGRSLGIELPLRTRRRRICITERVAPVLRHMVNGIRQESSGTFVLDPPQVIMEGGQGTDVTAEAGAMRRIVTAAVRHVPAVEAVRILHAPRWAFLEVADGRPAVGHLDDDLLVAIAADDQAATLAPIIGEAAADGITTHRWPDGLEIWAPGRFDAAATARASAGVQDSTQRS